jgi:hypothetical protein
MELCVVRSVEKEMIWKSVVEASEGNSGSSGGVGFDGTS